MKFNRKILGANVALLASMTTTSILNALGGFKSFPYLIQCLLIILIPIGFIIVMKIEKKRYNSVQNKIALLFIYFFIIMFVLLFIIIVLNNSFPNVWQKVNGFFKVITLLIFGSCPIYIIIFVAKNKNTLGK